MIDLIRDGLGALWEAWEWLYGHTLGWAFDYTLWPLFRFLSDHYPETLFGVDTVVVSWTIVSAATVSLTGSMAVTRNRNLTALYELPREERPDDFTLRTYLARQDIRRSMVRFTSSICALTVGASLWVMQASDAVDEWLHIIRNWPWLLVVMQSLICLNEILDRWSLERFRRLYRQWREA